MEEGVVPGCLPMFYWEARVIRDHPHEQREKGDICNKAAQKFGQADPIGGQLPTTSSIPLC